MARETTLTCPSGLTVRFRSIKGKDLDGLRDKKLAATGESISNLLDNCTLEILSRGLYETSPNFKWIDALVGDQTAAFIGLRQATTGNLFDFRIRCQDQDCKNMIDWELDLNELEKQPLSPTSAAIFLAGNVFDTSINETAIKFKLKTGHDSVRIAKQLSRIRLNAGRNEFQAKALLSLAFRIVSIEGVLEQDKLEWLEELDLRDLKDLMKQMDEVDCGVETTIEILCTGAQGCGLRQEVELPLDAKFFKAMVT